MASNLFIGLMSGTSLDGVDAVLVDFSFKNSDLNPQSQLLQTHFLPYPEALRSQVLALQHPTHNELETTQLVGNQLAKLYAEVVNQLITKAKVTAKGHLCNRLSRSNHSTSPWLF